MSANTLGMRVLFRSPGLRQQQYCCVKTRANEAKPASVSLTSTPVFGSPAKRLPHGQPVYNLFL